MRKQAAVVQDEVQPRRLAGDPMAGRHERGSDDEEQHERADLDEGEPELDLAEPLHRHHVHAAHEGQRREREDPLRHVRESAPIFHVQGDRRDIDDAGHGPVEIIHPAGDVGAAFAEELAGIGHEAAGRRAVHHEFAQGAQDQEREGAAEQVHERQRRTGELQPSARPQEEARADGAAHRDHLHLARLEAFLVALLMRVEPAPPLARDVSARRRVRCGHEAVSNRGARGRDGLIQE